MVEKNAFMIYKGNPLPPPLSATLRCGGPPRDATHKGYPSGPHGTRALTLRYYKEFS